VHDFPEPLGPIVAATGENLDVFHSHVELDPIAAANLIHGSGARPAALVRGAKRGFDEYRKPGLDADRRTFSPLEHHSRTLNPQQFRPVRPS
jgi:hypothetical protein